MGTRDDENNIPKKMNGWQEWGKFVLKELDRMNTNYEKMNGKLHVMELQLAQLETKFNIKSGIWGLIAGMIPVAVYIFYRLIK